VRLQWCLSRLLVAVLLCAMPASAPAQSLADAARRAEEERQQAPADTHSFTDRDLVADRVTESNREALSLVLTRPLLQQYSTARTALLQAMVQSPDLARQVVGAVGRAGQRGVDGLEHEYAMIPPAVDAIRAGQMDVHSYTVTEAAFMLAVGVLAGKLSVPQTADVTVAANVAFLQSHQQDIAMWFKDAANLEAQLAKLLQNPGQLR
jgi:hypothetical protein